MAFANPSCGPTITNKDGSFISAQSTLSGGDIAGVQSLYQMWAPHRPVDYTGDGRADITVFRPSSGIWLMLDSGNDQISEVQWDASNDVPVPGDYDGDGRTEYAVWRPTTGEWIWLGEDRLSSFVRQWGTKSDTPVPGDYDGDGTLDPAVYRSSEGRWYITTSYGPTSSRVWGVADDVVVP